jgi:N-acetylgalactosamine-6-sulfatase
MPDWLDPKTTMLPRLFKQAGYVTGHFGKWHLTNSGVTDAPLPTEYGYDESAVFNGPGVQVNVNDACDKAIDFIERHRQESFLLNLWVHETHVPHYPSEESMKRFSYLDEQRQVYAAVVADGDKRIGKILDALSQLGLENNTLVIFSSDNGPEITGGRNNTRIEKAFGTYYSVGTTGGLRGRKRSLLEGGIRTPFFVRWPGVVPDGKINKTTEITAVDMMPTLCAAAAIPLPADYKPDGENMLDAFKGKKMNRTKPICFEWLGTHSGDNWPCLGIRFDKWKLLMSSDQSRVELYDIPRDREESKNLAQQNPEAVKDLVAMIMKWKAQLPKSPSPDCISKLRKEKS